GGFTKPEIRAMAEERDLPVFSKPDSQEICFVPDQNYAGLVERRTGAFEDGDVVDTAGNVLGQHAGYQKYTIGQRKGLRLAVGKPVYVTSIDPQSNRVVVGERDDLLSTGLVADQCNLIAQRAIDAWHPMPCQAQIRYNADPVEATMQRTGDDKIEVRFATPQSAVSPGQAVCLYDSEVVLGGGWIERAV
ncbi:MAG: tRNA methyl transferase PRC-barrel domain-containing protein, partial [Planctomycetota bacterium]